MINKRKIKNRTQKTRKNNAVGKFFYRLTLLVFCGAIIYILFFSKLLLVNNIAVEGNNIVNGDKIEEKIKAYLSGKYLYFIDKNNIALLNTWKAEDEIGEEFKKIEKLKIKRNFPSSILVEITERKPALFFHFGNNCFLIDEKGVAFEKLNCDSQEINDSPLPILHDESNRELIEKENVFSQEYVSFILALKDKMKSEFGLDLKKDYNTPNRVSGDIRVETSENWKIYFSQSLDIKKEISMLKAVLENKISREQWNNLEYVDARSDNKVFYKFKDGFQEEMKEENKNSPEVEGAVSQDKDDSKKKKKKK
ncbi:MAG TPA: FtsQ-type POTRA domain-containing protein [Candidatus Moranbacteria bacterium]|nr:FtsQ-type POTRA domain-containing protein [Candidatus Moranbacteria bacterium]